jgi:large subunit ribosomal protein L25
MRPSFSPIENRIGNPFPAMKQITLKTTPREKLGRTASRHFRDSGTIPAVIYGESGHRNLAVDAHEFAMAYRSFRGSAALIELKSEGHEAEATYAIIQELQRNPRTDGFVHIDFKEIVRGKDMEADIPVHTRGTASGVRNYGGVLELGAHTLRVRCRPRHLPEFILIDVTDLDIGRSIHLSEVTAPEGVTFLDESDLVIASCVGASAGASGLTDEEAETAEPALVGEESEAEADSEED